MSAFLKWTAGILAVLAFLAWPYYSLYELGRGIAAGDAATINRLVDWDSVRPSLKAQTQTLLAAMPGLTNQLGNSASASVGAPSMAPIIANANTYMDSMLTPEGVEKMLKA